MQSTDVCNLVHKESLNKVPTGLFVSWEKSGVLLNIVQNILRKQFKTVAETGSRENDNTCEIFLRALEPSSGANFSASKDLLESYLDMIKESKPRILVAELNEESKPNLLVEKQPEIIDLIDEDEDVSCIELDNTVNDSVTVVDPDSSAASGPDRHSSREGENMNSFSSNMTICQEEVMVIDLPESTQCSLPDKMETGWDLKDSNHPGLKIKKESEKAEIEVVDILDDDVIILDDSISVPECNGTNQMVSSFGDFLKITLDGDNRFVSSEPVVKVTSLSERKKKKKASKKRKKQQAFDLFCKSQSIIPFPSPKTVPSTRPVLDDFRESQTIVPLASPKKVLNLDEFHEWQSVISSFPPKKVQKLDDSRVIVSDEPEIIVIKNVASYNSTNKPNTESSSSSPKRPSKFSYKRPAHLSAPLIKSSSSEVPKADTATNIYNPNADKTEKRTGLRPIVIDGNNVAVSHGKGQFSVKGIQICINYFEKRGHRQIKAFVPHYRKNHNTFDALKKMEQQGTVVITPSRKVEGKTVASYDDRYIVQYASEVGGVVVSTDNYRDLLQENASWKDTIDNRLLMFTWVDDLLMFPQDPLGRRGPSLEDFLKFPD